MGGLLVNLIPVLSNDIGPLPLLSCRCEINLKISLHLACLQLDLEPNLVCHNYEEGSFVRGEQDLKGLSLWQGP